MESKEQICKNCQYLGFTEYLISNQKDSNKLFQSKIKASCWFECLNFKSMSKTEMIFLKFETFEVPSRCAFILEQTILNQK